MPNHWETSARPLFIKTVFVNGNRHAVLFEKDPLLNCGNYRLKKISRSNSLLSFASDLSVSSSESQDLNVESKKPKVKNFDQAQRKDLSSELQSCLVKLKLASDSLEKKKRPGDEKCFCNSKEFKRSQSSELKQEKHKRIHEKTYAKDHGERDCEELRGCKLSEGKSSGSSCCYVYNLENSKRKKNYCFVKISSQQPKLILNCSCEKNWKETYECNLTSKNNFVISATIHNIVMSSSGNENLLENTFDYVFENSEFYWNNYLTRSYYNSLSEKVLQWLDLTKKRRKKEMLNLTNNDESSGGIERIFSGKTFADEIKKSDYSCASKILTNKKTGNTLQTGKHEEEVEREVTGEPNIETVVSAETLSVATLNPFSRDFIRSYEEESQNNKITKEALFSKDSNFVSKGFKIKESNTSISSLIKSPIKIQDLLLNCDAKDYSFFQDQKKVNEILDASSGRRKPVEEENSEDDDLIKTALKNWQKKVRKKSNQINKFDSHKRQSQCHCSGNLDIYPDKIRSHILTEEFAEKNQKSINNLDITQTRPLLIQNLLSPQQQNQMTYWQEEKIVWACEKNTGRPQLHIFLPTIQFRDQSDDSMSECENFLNT